MAPSASIEWLCPHGGLIRLHERPDGRFGDGYGWTAMLARDGMTVEIKGVDKPVPPGGMRAINDALHRAGIRKRFHIRMGPPLRLIVRDVVPPRA